MSRNRQTIIVHLSTHSVYYTLQTTRPPEDVSPQQYTKSGSKEPCVDAPEKAQDLGTKGQQWTTVPGFGHRHSRVYPWAGCPDDDKVSTQHRVPFPSQEAAKKAGYRPAKHCP